MGDLGKKIGYGLLVLGSGALGHWIAKHKYMNRKVTFGLVGGMALLSGIYTCNKEIVPAGVEIWKQNSAQEQIYERDKLHLQWQQDSLEKSINRELIREGKLPIEGNYLRKLDEQKKELEKKTEESADRVRKDISNIVGGYHKENVSKIGELDKKISEIQSSIQARPLSEIKKEVQTYNAPVIKQSSIESYIIEADKSDHTATLFGMYGDGSKKVLGLYKANFAQNGTKPDNGTYPVIAISKRSGYLWPGVIKMTDIVVISGAGENGEYESNVDRNIDNNRTGIRLHNNDYLNLTSKLTPQNTVIKVQN